MKAVVFHGVGGIRLDDVEEPEIQAATDAILSVTRSAICGTDLHMVRGNFPGIRPGTILGHEAVGAKRAGRRVGEPTVGAIRPRGACGGADDKPARRYVETR